MKTKVHFQFLLLCTMTAVLLIAGRPARAQQRKQENPREILTGKMKKGNDLLKEKKFQQAVAVFKEARQIKAENAKALENANWLDPDSSLVQTYMQWSIELQKANQYEESLDKLKLGIEEYPENEQLKNRYETVDRLSRNRRAGELHNKGHQFLRQNKFAEAVEAFEECVELRPDLDAYKNSLIDAYEKNAQFSEAAELLKVQIEEIRENPKWDQAKRMLEESRLRQRHIDALAVSGLGRVYIREARERLADAPTSAALHNYLGDLLLDMGDKQVALSHFLIAAVELDAPDFFVERVFDFRVNQRDQVVLNYYRALIYHLPTHPRSVQAVDRLVQHFERRGRRFAFSDEERRYYAEAEKAAAYISHQPDIDQNLKNEADFRKIQYHYEPLDGQLQEWEKAIGELDQLRSRKTISGGLEKRISQYIASIYSDYLKKPDKAFEILLGYFKKSPDERILQEICDVAFEMPEIPDDNFLEGATERKLEEIKKRDEKEERREIIQDYRDLAAYEAALASWHYEKGRVEKARQIAERYSEAGNDDPGRKREQRRFTNYVRRMSRSFYSTLQQRRRSPGSDIVEIREDRVFSTERATLGPGKPGHVHRSLSLRVPEDIMIDPVLQIQLDERPAIADPPVFFIPDEKKQYHATWRTLPTEPNQVEPDARTFALSTHWEWKELKTDVSLNLEMSDMGAEENSYLCEIDVISSRPYQLKVDLFRWTRSQKGAKPEPSKQKGQTLIYENQEPTTGTLGRRYRIPINRINNRTPEEVAPTVELMIVQEEQETQAKPSGNTWKLNAPGQLANSIELLQEDGPASGALRVRTVLREIHMLGGGWSRW